MLPGGRGKGLLAGQLAGLGASDRVVDVGCGPGGAVRYAASVGASAVGIDPAAVMLRVAQLLTRGGGGVRFAMGSAEQLPLPESSMTVWWSVACVHHWSDLDAGLEEAQRVLVPAGRLVAIERRSVQGARGLAAHGWTDDQASAFANRCASAGLNDVRVSDHRLGHRAVLAVTASNSSNQPPGLSEPTSDRPI
jgi:ubiquinone/menaquinone biosynthesis C-methylase UbiE